MLAQDHDVFYEWATFIRTIHPCVLVVVHRGEIDRPRSGLQLQSCSCHRVRPQSPGLAPIFEKSQRTLLPLLKEGWSGLERILTRGVSRKVLRDLDEMEGIRVEVDERIEPYWNTNIAKD